MPKEPGPKAKTSARLARLRCIQFIVDGPIRYELRRVSCSNPRCKQCILLPNGSHAPSHGPYWYMLTRNPETNARMTVYLGKVLDTNKYRTSEGSFDYEAFKAHCRPPQPTD